MGRKTKWPPTIHVNQKNQEFIRVRENGKPREIYLGPCNSEKARTEYRRVIADLDARNRHPLPAKGKNITLAVLFLAFYEHAKIRFAGSRDPAGVLDRIKSATTVATRLCGHTQASEFGPLGLKAIRSAMISGNWLNAEERKKWKEKGRKIGWSRTFVNQCTSTIRRAIKWAVSEELVSAIVLNALLTVEDLRRGEEGVREGRGKIRPVDNEVVNRTLPWLLPEVADLVRLMLLTGMRSDEATQLRPCDINTEGRDPSGRIWPGVWVFTPAHHKTEGEDELVKVVFLGPRCQAILMSYLKGRKPSSWCFDPREAMEHRRLRRRAARKSKVQPSQTDRRKPNPVIAPRDRYTPSAVQQAIARAVRRHNQVATAKDPAEPLLPHWTQHQLRHTLSTWVRAKLSLEHAKSALGQESVDSTLIYAERDLEKALEVARQLG